MKTKEVIIVQNAAKLFSQHGIKKITMDDVSRACGMSKRTIYESLGSKKKLVEKTLDYLQGIDMEIIEKSGMQKQDAMDEIMFLIKHINQWFKEFSTAMENDLRLYYPQKYAEINRIREKRIYNIIFNNIKKGIKEGVYRKDLDADIIARLVITRMQSLMENNWIRDAHLASDHFYNEVYLYHMQGLMNDYGRKVFKRKYPGNLGNTKPTYDYSFVGVN